VKRFVSLQFLNPKTVGRTPRTGDQSIARPLPIQTQTNIHAMSGIRTQDPSVRAGEDSKMFTVASIFSYIYIYIYIYEI
jgi:hypothetical protein